MDLDWDKAAHVVDKITVVVSSPLLAAVLKHVAMVGLDVTEAEHKRLVLDVLRHEVTRLIFMYKVGWAAGAGGGWLAASGQAVGPAEFRPPTVLAPQAPQHALPPQNPPHALRVR